MRHLYVAETGDGNPRASMRNANLLPLRIPQFEPALAPLRRAVRNGVVTRGARPHLPLLQPHRPPHGPRPVDGVRRDGQLHRGRNGQQLGRLGGRLPSGRHRLRQEAVSQGRRGALLPLGDREVDVGGDGGLCSSLVSVYCPMLHCEAGAQVGQRTFSGKNQAEDRHDLSIFAESILSLKISRVMVTDHNVFCTVKSFLQRCIDREIYRQIDSLMQQLESCGSSSAAR
jgi:hypothetical protein